MLLPAAYELSGALTHGAMKGVAYNGSYDIYKQSLGGVDLCITRFRLPTQYDKMMAKRVFRPYVLGYLSCPDK